MTLFRFLLPLFALATKPSGATSELCDDRWFGGTGTIASGAIDNTLLRAPCAWVLNSSGTGNQVVIEFESFNLAYDHEMPPSEQPMKDELIITDAYSGAVQFVATGNTVPSPFISRVGAVIEIRLRQPKTILEGRGRPPPGRDESQRVCRCICVRSARRRHHVLVWGLLADRR